MTIRQAFTLVLATTLAFTAIGGLIGFLLGRFLPNYYRSIFIQGREPDFDPLAVGVGQGLTQGVTAGAVVGVSLVALMTWYRVKSRKSDDDHAS